MSDENEDDIAKPTPVKENRFFSGVGGRKYFLTFFIFLTTSVLLVLGKVDMEVYKSAV